jgi:Protein of unknown function (DUF3306)
VALADERDSGFLGRWSQRKAKAAQGLPLAEPLPEKTERAAPAAEGEPAASVAATDQATPSPGKTQASGEPAPPALTLEDAKLLTKDSDFKPFMAGNVSADVRNAAMKKLFADPHFNVMDGLDIYIDDYSISEPIPESMLRQMVGARFLNLFGEEEKDDRITPESPALPAVGVERDNAGQSSGETAAPSNEASPSAGQFGAAAAAAAEPSDPLSQPAISDAGASHTEHDHTDLRLQPDDAARGRQAGHGSR